MTGMDKRHKLKWTLYISLALFFLLVSLSNRDPLLHIKESLYPIFQFEDPQKYIIVFDGGSTGTRIHVFTFENSSSGLLTLKDAYYQEVKPGLSSFAHKPKKAAYSVSSLLEKAKSQIPVNSWDETPVTLKATAGLRLLPNHLSDSILDEVYQLFKESPFLIDDNSVSVLDGEDEGIYSWYTINFLLGRLSDRSQSVASLDLGGGSTQVTFSPVNLDTIIFSPRGYIVSTKIENKTMNLYTHSYLGFGLMSARLAILHLSSKNAEETAEANVKTFQSSCIHPNTRANFRIDRKEFLVTGREDGIYGFDACYEKVLYFLGDMIDQPEELSKREIYGLSYYFDRAVDMQMIGEKGGIVTVEDFMNAAKKACSAETKKPFLCLDSTYITAFLHHGLGLPKAKEIVLAKRINGIEAGWGLGAAFNLLQ